MNLLAILAAKAEDHTLWRHIKSAFLIMSPLEALPPAQPPATHKMASKLTVSDDTEDSSLKRQRFMWD